MSFIPFILAACASFPCRYASAQFRFSLTVGGRLYTTASYEHFPQNPARFREQRSYPHTAAEHACSAAAPKKILTRLSRKISKQIIKEERESARGTPFILREKNWEQSPRLRWRRRRRRTMHSQEKRSKKTGYKRGGFACSVFLRCSSGNRS